MVWSAPEHANDIHYANAYKSEPAIWESKLGKNEKNKIKWMKGKKQRKGKKDDLEVCM